MAGIREIAREYRDEIMDGIAWVAIWKTGRAWNARSFWLDGKDRIEGDEIGDVERIVAEDPDAIFINEYECAHMGEGTLEDIVVGIRFHYRNGYNKLAEWLYEGNGNDSDMSKEPLLDPAEMEEPRQKDMTEETVEPMGEELEFLEGLLLQYEELKDMGDEKSEDARKKYDMLIRIAKLVRAESLNMELRKKAGHYDVATIAQRLLNESATACVRRNANSTEVEILDEIHRNVIAKFEVKIALRCLMFMDAQFF